MKGKKIFSAFLSSCVILSSVAVTAAVPGVTNISGVDGTQFGGGNMKVTSQINFADLFEGDGSNGTNGTVAWTVTDKNTGAVTTEGLKATKLADGIKFSRAGTEGANPGRAQAILDKTYVLPEIANPGEPYYLELNAQVNAGGAINFDFGSNEGTDSEPSGNADVVRIRKLDDYTGSDSVAGAIEGPAAYAFRIGDTTKVKATYTSKEDVSLGLYVIPALGEVVYYKNGSPVEQKIESFSNPESAIETLRITWYQNIRWYNIPEAEYLTIKNFKVFEGAGIPDDKRLGLDYDSLTFASLTDESESGVTKDLTLPSSGKFGSDIKWTSSNPEVVNPETGAVTRQTETVTVTLTATLSRNGESREKTFELTVPQKGTDGNLLTGAKVTIDGTSSIEAVSNLTDGLFNTYIETMDEGKKPTVTIDMGEVKKISKVIIYEGKINDKYNIKSGVLSVSEDGSDWTTVGETDEVGANKVISFIPVEARYIKYRVTGLDSTDYVRIYEIEAVMDASDSQIVQADAKNLKAFDDYKVTKSTVFETTGRFGSSIRWTSSDTSLVDTVGNVTRPKGSGKSITITAYVSYGSAEKSISFNHYVEGTTSTVSGGGSSGGGGGRGSVSSGGSLVNPVDKPAENPDNNNSGNNSGSSEFRFNDVPESSWAYSYIMSLYKDNIISGSGNGNFEPERSILREEFLKLLLSAMDIKYDDAKGNIFTDVNDNDWFAPVIAKAYEIGLINGLPDGSFGAGQTITRQDMAVLAKRMCDINDVKLTENSKAALADFDSVSDYAKESVQALADAGIICGDENGRFAPEGTALREQAAKIIYQLRALK